MSTFVVHREVFLRVVYTRQEDRSRQVSPLFFQILTGTLPALAQRNLSQSQARRSSKVGSRFFGPRNKVGRIANQGMQITRGTESKDRRLP